MKENTINVLMVEPHKHPKITKIRNDLDSLQKAVSIGSSYQDHIELVWIEEGAIILCNEEGKINGLEPNRRLEDDILCGVFYVVSEDEDGNLASLHPSMIEKYSSLFWDPEKIMSDEVLDTIITEFIAL